MDNIVAPVSTKASGTSTERTLSTGNAPFSALWTSNKFSIFAATVTLPMITISIVNLLY